MVNNLFGIKTHVNFIFFGGGGIIRENILGVFASNPVVIYLLKVNNRNTRTRCEICSKLTARTLERRYWRRSGVFVVNFEHISHLVLVFLLLTLNMQLPTGNMYFIVNKRSLQALSSVPCFIDSPRLILYKHGSHLFRVYCPHPLISR